MHQFQKLFENRSLRKQVIVCLSVTYYCNAPIKNCNEMAWGGGGGGRLSTLLGTVRVYILLSTETRRQDQRYPT